MADKDRLFENSITEPGDFRFDERVVSVFPDMINRSVPGYGTIVPMLAMLARRYARPDSIIYDLGCSLGAVSLAASRVVRAEGARIIAVDNSEAMIRGLEDRLGQADERECLPLELRLQDVRETEIRDASVVIMNFCLQFIEAADRGPLLERIAAGLLPGGVLLLSEKIRFDDPAEQVLQTEWHHGFKRAQGYSELEIARKRDALERVMKPDSFEQHRERLATAGFGSVYRWFQGFSFISLVAFR